MNRKNVNFIEQHIEKVIISVGALIAVVVMFFFVVRDYTVEIDGKQTSAGKVEDSVENSVKDLRKALNNTTTPPELRIPVAPYTERFRRRDQSIQKIAMLMQPIGAVQGLDPNDMKFTEPILSEYKLTTIPPPTNQVARAEFAVLKGSKDLKTIYAESVLDQLIGERLESHELDYGQHIAVRFAQLVVDEQPRDFEYISVMAEFDWEDWEQAMERVPEADRIPKELWHGQHFIADVVLERQVQNPQTGGWGAVVSGQWQADQITQVEPLPGALSFRNPHEELRPFEVKTLIRNISVQEQIVRPLFCPIEGFWLPPDELPKQRSALEERRLMRVNKDIGVLEDQLRKLEQKAAQKSKKRQKAAEARGADTAMKQALRKRQTGREVQRNVGKAKRTALGTTALRAGGRAGGTAGLGLGQAFTADQEIQEIRQRKQGKLASLYQEREELLFGVDPTRTEDPRDGTAPRIQPNLQMTILQRGNRRIFGGGGQFGPAGGAFGGMLGGGGAVDPLLGGQPGMRRFGNLGNRTRDRRDRQRDAADSEKQNTRITVWAHDITATPGGSYRYRLRVAVLNPLYQRDANLVGSQKHLADNVGMLTEPTDWTEPMHIHPKTYFFLVSGTRRDQEGIVEVYRIFNGKWRRHDFSVRPGEPIGGLRRMRTQDYEREVDLSVGAIVVHVDPDARSGAWVNRTTVKLVYLDVQNDRLMQRTVEQDKDDEMRIYLRNQSELEEEAAEMARSLSR